jgi:transcriptional regulator with XRE-family HTH domain
VAELLRGRPGRTVARVADRLGLEASHLGAVLRGELYPSHEVAVRLTAFLGVPVTELFTPCALAHLHEVRPGRPARPLTGAAASPYDVDDLALCADRPRGRVPRLPRDRPRALAPPRPCEPGTYADAEPDTEPDTPEAEL